MSALAMTASGRRTPMAAVHSVGCGSVCVCRCVCLCGGRGRQPSVRLFAWIAADRRTKGAGRNGPRGADAQSRTRTHTDKASAAESSATIPLRSSMLMPLGVSTSRSRPWPSSFAQQPRMQHAARRSTRRIEAGPGDHAELIRSRRPRPRMRSAASSGITCDRDLRQRVADRSEN